MIWLTRGTNPKLNRETGQVATGAYDSLVTGPDGISNSAMEFVGGTGLTIPMIKGLSGDFTIQFGFKFNT